MLLELHVSGLGVIGDARLRFAAGLTALSGETGAGKTLLVDALELVLGGPIRRGLVPTGATALVEAVFVDETGEELILAREVPSDGRAKAFVDGKLASASTLAERAAGLCDIYGQHEHQALLGAGSVRRSLDLFGALDTAPLRAIRSELRALEADRAALGGDPEAAQRAIALLEHQLAEIDRAGISDPSEIESLSETARLLDDALELRQEMEKGLELLEGDHGGVRDEIAGLTKAVEGYGQLAELSGALHDTEAALDELRSILRRSAEQIEEDPQRLTEINARLGLLHDLCRRHGPSLDQVLRQREAIAAELSELLGGEERRGSVDERRTEAQARLAEVEEQMARARREAAPRMAAAVGERLATLALERARVEIVVEGPAGDDVELLFSANPGLAPQPVAKVASGGELARLMLAIRLTMPAGPPTMVFDEVDAGIGGATAVTLAGALHELAQQRQVLVVTHLAQVAAAASEQIAVRKVPGETTTVASASILGAQERIGEIARMLSGQPDSSTARRHAAELLGE